jgi:hypothetical protein
VHLTESITLEEEEMADKAKPKENEKPADVQAGEADKKPETAGWGDKLKNSLAPIIGLALVVFYIIFLLSLRGQIKEDELYWTRWIYLLSGVEAIAFAAAGYFFGSEVHRKTAEAAQEDADEARQDANDANQRANEAELEAVDANAKGQALAASITAKTKSQARKRGTFGVLGGKEAASLNQSDFDELADLAKKLFP